MAYLDLEQGYPATHRSAPTRNAAQRVPSHPTTALGSLTALEWSVVAIAEHDRLSSLDEPGRISRAMGRLFGTQTNGRLADPRLEALRRFAVMAWNRGNLLPGSELARFEEAGFTPAQRDILLKSIGRAQMTRDQDLAA
jgi:hypothetical protein